MVWIILGSIILLLVLLLVDPAARTYWHLEDAERRYRGGYEGGRGKIEDLAPPPDDKGIGA